MELKPVRVLNSNSKNNAMHHYFSNRKRARKSGMWIPLCPENANKVCIDEFVRHFGTVFSWDLPDYPYAPYRFV